MPSRCSSTTRSSITWTRASTPPTATTTRVLGGVGRHLGEVDERHMILQEELVAHVHDLVKRIDLVLRRGGAGTGVLRACADLDLRERVKSLEERLRRG